MSLRAFRLAAACAAIASLSGCTFLGIDFNDEKVQYESSNSRANLEVPPDLTPIQNDNRFAVPSRNGVVSANAEAQRAQAASGQDPSAASSRIVPLTVSAKVMKDGQDRWLRVNAAPENSGRSCRTSGLPSVSSCASRIRRRAIWKRNGRRTVPSFRRTLFAARSARLLTLHTPRVNRSVPRSPGAQRRRYDRYLYLAPFDG